MFELKVAQLCLTPCDPMDIQSKEFSRPEYWLAWSTPSPGNIPDPGIEAVDINSPQIKFSLVQFSRSVVSDSLQPHESQHARPPCPSPTPGIHSDSRPLSQ